ncbi:RDD family protein [Paenibacillus sp. N3.4]|uniref:RDD family protein n=1 Tax=Paenibacillus sp. N3.4 TaxID=2603222 RepID=UPI0011CBF7B8|nr:RDD family protein [Paenibacillus sp. N3.4]TXK72382.1 RDD family protein [Paenibacillus sp. N3.4]
MIKNLNWYYKEGNQSFGPYSSEEISNLFNTDLIKKNTLLKNDESGDWLSAEIYEEFNIAKTQVRPWMRMWARQIDMFVFGFLVGVLLEIISVFAPYFGLWKYIFGMILLILWILIEAVLLSTIGTTLGKFLFGVKVHNENGLKLTFKQAMKRGLLVWWRGLGMGIPVITLITYWDGYNNLKHKLRETTWDRDLGITVTHRRKTIWNEIVIYIVIAAFALYRYVHLFK